MSERVNDRIRARLELLIEDVRASDIPDRGDALGHLAQARNWLRVRTGNDAGSYSQDRGLAVEDFAEVGARDICWCDGPDCGQTPCIEVATDAEVAR